MGFAMMMFGTMMITSPIGHVVNYLRYIPLLGGIAASLINLGIFLAGVTVSVMGSLLVIGASWLLHRPVLAIALLGTAAAVSVGTYVLQRDRGRTRQAAGAAAAAARCRCCRICSGGGNTPLRRLHHAGHGGACHRRPSRLKIKILIRNNRSVNTPCNKNMTEIATL